MLGKKYLQQKDQAVELFFISSFQSCSVLQTFLFSFLLLLNIFRSINAKYIALMQGHFFMGLLIIFNLTVFCEIIFYFPELLPYT